LIGERFLKLDIFNTLFEINAKSIPQIEGSRSPFGTAIGGDFGKRGNVPETIQLFEFN
jgi:hypothetical protein